MPPDPPSISMLLFNSHTLGRTYQKLLPPPLNILHIIVLNDVTHTSHEQRLITKEHIATHANLIPPFKPTLYSSTLEIKPFESSIKLFYAEILTIAL